MIFALEDFDHLTAYLKVMFGLGGVPVADAALGYYLRSYLPVLLLCGISSTPLGAIVYKKLSVRQQQVATTVLVVAGLLICTAYLVASTYNPFLYFRF